MKSIWCLSLILLLFNACKRFQVSPKENSAWDSQWLLPLVHGELSIDDIREITESGAIASVSSLDLGFVSGVQVSVPPTVFERIGPFAIPTNDWIKSIGLDSLDASISLTNILPITIDQGTSFVLRNSPDTTSQTNILYKYVLPKTIYPNEFFNVDINIPLATTLGDSIYFSLEKFSTQGGDSLMFSSNPMKCEVRLRAAAINRIELYSNKELKLTDTIALSINAANEIDAKDGDSVYVKLKLENKLPLEQDFQLYFVHPFTQAVQDSLLESPIRLLAAETTSAGTPLNSHSQEVSFGLSRKRMEVLAEYKKGVLSYRLSTKHATKPTVAANKNCTLSFKFIGDFNLNYSFLRK